MGLTGKMNEGIQVAVNPTFCAAAYSARARIRRIRVLYGKVQGGGYPPVFGLPITQ